MTTRLSNCAHGSQTMCQGTLGHHRRLTGYFKFLREPQWYFLKLYILQCLSYLTPFSYKFFFCPRDMWKNYWNTKVLRIKKVWHENYHKNTVYSGMQSFGVVWARILFYTQLKLFFSYFLTFFSDSSSTPLVP